VAIPHLLGIRHGAGRHLKRNRRRLLMPAAYIESTSSIPFAIHGIALSQSSLSTGRRHRMHSKPWALGFCTPPRQLSSREAAPLLSSHNRVV
jgi:hypothetical protein